MPTGPRRIREGHPRPQRGDRHGDPSRPEAWGGEVEGLPSFGQGRPPGAGRAPEAPLEAGWWRDHGRLASPRAHDAARPGSSGPRGYRRSDERILENCWQRLSSDPDLAPEHIGIAVEEGLVRLAGEVRSRSEKLHAEDLCASVPGVVDVHNRLRVSD